MEEEAEATTKKTKQELESEITDAMLARVNDFKEQADSLTLEGVRRALEKDLGMEKFSLDTHKKFIKQCLDKCFYGADEKNASESEKKIAEEPSQPMKKERPRQSEDLERADDLRSSDSDQNGNAEGSPGGGHTDDETENHQGSKNSSDLDEETIKEALRKRASYFRANLDITLAKVRRLLEEDLKLEKNTLDAFKKLISNELDEILQSEASNGAKKESKKTSQSRGTGKKSKGSKKASSDSDSSGSSDISSGDEKEEEEIRRPRKRPAPKAQTKTKALKKQKISSEENKLSGSKKKKPVESDIDKSDESDPEKASEDGGSQSSAEEEVKKKDEKPTTVYGKQVERLKSILKSCGMGIPPSVYKRAKQAPESKREAQLIKELESILEREGLSADPSEKEIKDVKKRKERAKELEGIDMSNIVTSSRRRATSFIPPPPKPKIEVTSDEDAEGEDDGEEDDNEDETDNDDGDSSEGSDGDDAEEDSD